MNYEILEHTGDAKIRVWGKNKEELFKRALLGMAAILKPRIKSKELRIKKIRVQSSDINALLVDFLSEVNYIRQVHREVYNKVEFSEFLDTGLSGELSGYKAEEFGEDIKAVTFHGLDVKKNKDGTWEAVIVFDM